MYLYLERHLAAKEQSINRQYMYCSVQFGWTLDSFVILLFYNSNKPWLFSMSYWHATHTASNITLCSMSVGRKLTAKTCRKYLECLQSAIEGFMTGFSPSLEFLNKCWIFWLWNRNFIGVTAIAWITNSSFAFRDLKLQCIRIVNFIVTEICMWKPLQFTA